MTLTKDFHPAQLTYVLESRRTAKYGNIATFVLGISACIVCVLPSHWSLKVSNIAIASGLFITSYKLEKLQKWSDDYQHSTNHESIKGYGLHLNTSFAPPRREIAIAQPNIVESLAPVKFADIKTALSKPHMMLLGETNSGKSTLVKFLVSHASAPSLVLDSHAAPDDWQNMNVIGMGRNYPAIGQEVDLLVKLMDTRYEARGKGQKQFEPLIVVLDEFPACVANLPKSFTENIMLLVREARKISIKLIVLSQGSEVKSLGIEGQGSIRECFAMIAIGKFATEKAKSLKDEQVKLFIDSAEYPAMLDDLPCQLPKIDRVNLPALPLPKDYQLLIADNAIAPDYEPIDRPLNQQSALTAPAMTTSAPSATNQQSATLSASLLMIVDYAKRKDEFVSARQVQSGIAIFKQSKADEIREYFKYLATLGYGVTRGDGDNLEFSAG